MRDVSRSTMGAAMKDVSRVMVGVAALLFLLTVPAAAAIAQEVPPNSEVDQYVPNFAGAEGTSVTAATSESQSWVSALVDALTGDGNEGMGFALPLLLVLIAGGGVAFALRRRVGGSARRG